MKKPPLCGGCCWLIAEVWEDGGDFAEESFGGAVVVDYVGRAFDLFGLGHLGVDTLLGFFFGEAVSAHEPLELGLFVEVDDDCGVEAVLFAGLEEEGELDEDEAFVGVLFEGFVEFGEHEGFHELVEFLPLGGVAEDEFAHFFAVDFAGLLIEDVFGLEGCVDCGVVADEVADFVHVDDDVAHFFEISADGGFATCDVAGDGDDF